MPRIVTLTTDFGEADGYVGAVKGVLLSGSSEAQVVDISHQVAPGDILGGALTLLQAVPFFPPATVHLAVVDPGVGSHRHPIIVETEKAILVGPDNGLLSLVAPASCAVRRIESASFRRPEPAPTFHGRDIFAAAAAQLLRGAPAAEAGPALPDLQRLRLPRPQRAANEIDAEVLHVDRFGNLLTTVTAADLGDTRRIRVLVGEVEVAGLRQTFAEVAVGEPLAYLGSTGFLELAVRNRSAAQMFGACRGQRLRVLVEA